MGKNKGKGGKSKRKGKNKNDEGEKRELLLKEEGQQYGQITKILGNCRVEVFCFDGQIRMGHVRGKFRKKVWINRDDIVLIGLRDYQDGKCDIIHKYTSDEARRLKNRGELPAKTKIVEDVEEGEDDIVDFDEESEEEESDSDDDARGKNAISLDDI
jgi:translation initiation factor 1A